MDESNDIIEQDPGPQIPAEPAPEITSRFLFVDVAALRAKQLRRGARVRFREGEAPPVAHKAERVAMEEVRRGLVYYDVPPAGAGSDGRNSGETNSSAGAPARGFSKDEA
jgi:DNA-directed RNA polymerase subunit K/omega